MVLPPRCSSVVWFVRTNGRMNFVRLPVACGDVGCGRLICSTRDALLEDESFQISFKFDGLLGDMGSHATIGILKHRGKERPHERCQMVPSLSLTLTRISRRLSLCAKIFMLRGQTQALTVCRVRASRNGVLVTKRPLIIALSSR